MRNFFNFLKSKTFLIQLGLAVLVLIITIFLVLRYLNSTTNHGEFVEVPDFSKKSVMEMRKSIEEAGLRYEVLDSANYNPDYPRFSIIEQNPTAGSKVKENRKVYFTVNPSGYKKVTVPQIIQVTKRNASSMLKAVGLDVQRVTYIDELGKDMVYRIKFKGKDIKPGDKLPKTSKIELICGNGSITERAIIKSESED
ncbi:MAG: PASTA domain-containing protein [Maribacter dokdonensis]|uniref:PASTA domain-containing protein n=1 Tax=Maribacter dokdonensis TaxID=320912 RepID=A0A1H4J9L7_9FLAO|nr:MULTISPECIES: PASTA domain-containing protein [Maribacter]HAF78484.1 PASTA domain-containing protein [Maribacter sp.]KSA11709.1 Protein PASTA domain-containing protein [Maribacter dokdonensis DSW-8]MBU2899435.1 PASTA domain-containing protein [Maribacter dokdonensis]MDP2527986.1 PASTA domain-containing protein [Maribacter dokdonensis]PHN93033.1 PASTA domain-containing protein [Maribacter sp. 6B07]|tara:strand:+ start:2062 stop:2652 length:591 start_codon:yes stop_codon:yes gene_type:complete